MSVAAVGQRRLIAAVATRCAEVTTTGAGIDRVVVADEIGGQSGGGIALVE